jgi:hypothetical protein
MASIAAIAPPGLAYVSMVAPMVIAATGIAMAMPAVQKAVVGSVSPPDIGKASGTYPARRYRRASRIAVHSAIQEMSGSSAQLSTKDLVHHLGALGEGGPDLVAVNQLRGGSSVMPGQQRDALYRYAVGGQDRHKVCLISRGAQPRPSPAFSLIFWNALITLSAFSGVPTFDEKTRP